MFVSQLLPDLQSLLPNVEFGTRLEIHIDAPTDPKTAPTITVSADGRLVELPTLAAGEAPGFPVA